MDFKQYAKTRNADLPTLVKHGDSFARIESMTVKSIDYQGKPTQVGTLVTDKGLFGTFSSVLIKNLQEFFDANPNQILENVRIVEPRGKKYLTLEGI